MNSTLYAYSAMSRRISSMNSYLLATGDPLRGTPHSTVDPQTAPVKPRQPNTGSAAVAIPALTIYRERSPGVWCRVLKPSENNSAMR